MADFYIDVAPTGDRVRAAHNGTPAVIFNDDPPIVLPAFSNGVAIHPQGHACLVRARNDRVYRVTRQGAIINLDPVVGTYSVGYSPAGLEYWIRSPTVYVAGGVHETVPTEHGDSIYGQGWTQILDTGAPAWTAHVSPILVDGRVLTRPVQKGPWLVGMETVSPDRILAVDLLTHAWYRVWSDYTNHGPSLAIVGGEPRVGISLPGVVIPRALFVPLPPDPPPPDPDCRFHACAMSGWTGTRPSFLAGTVGWSTPDYDRRLRYDGMPWASDLPGDVPCWGLVIGTESDVPPPYASKAEQLDATIAFAKYRGCGVVVYGDDPVWRSTSAPALFDRVKAAGVRAVVGLQLMAQAGLSPAGSEELAEEQVRQQRTLKRKVVIVSTARARFDKTLALAPLVHKLIDEKYKSTIVGHVVFDGAGPGGLPAVRDYWTRIWAMMPSGVVTPL